MIIYSGKIGEMGHLVLEMVQICKLRVFGQNLDISLK